MNTTGILNIDKPSGWASFRVVSLVRRLSGERRVGHAGTLDPAATGVLLLLLGQAVRISGYLMELPKTYRAEVKLGLATDTYDVTGEPILEGDPSTITEPQLRETLLEFVGEIRQAPPPYSAVKIGGRPAYRYARAGRPLTPAARPAIIHRIDLLSFQPPLVALEAECGKGTYIRSLAHDLGQRLGCGAHLHSLVRTRIGPFHLEDASSIDALKAAFLQGNWQERLSSLDFGLGHLPAVTLDAKGEQDVRHGRPLLDRLPPFQRLKGASAGQGCRVLDDDGSLLAILRFDASAGLWRPEKVFASALREGN